MEGRYQYKNSRLETLMDPSRKYSLLDLWYKSDIQNYREDKWSSWDRNLENKNPRKCFLRDILESCKKYILSLSQHTIYRGWDRNLHKHLIRLNIGLLGNQDRKCLLRSREWIQAYRRYIL